MLAGSSWLPAPTGMSGDDHPPLGSLGITRCVVDQQITVPTGTRVRVTASTGDLVATDLTAGSLEAHLTRGSITASFTRPPDRVLARADLGPHLPRRPPDPSR